MFQLVAMNIYWKQSLRGVSWNQIKSENIEILYPLESIERTSADRLKESMHCYGASMNVNADIFVKYLQPISWHWCFSILTEIHQQTRGCLMFSGDIEGDQCHEMG